MDSNVCMRDKYDNMYAPKQKIKTKLQKIIKKMKYSDNQANVT